MSLGSSESAKRELEFKKALADVMTSFFRSAAHGQVDVTLKAPCKITCKDRTDRYSVAPFIGGERFTASAAYVGKKGQIIMVFAPKAPQRFSFIEVPVGQVKEHFGAELITVIDEWMNHKDDEYSLSVMEKLANAERKAINEVIATQAATSPDFATW